MKIVHVHEYFYHVDEWVSFLEIYELYNVCSYSYVAVGMVEIVGVGPCREAFEDCESKRK